MTLVPLIQTIIVRIVLMLAFATPTLLITWTFCRFATISAASKVFMIRMTLIKSLVVDIILVGSFGLFNTIFLPLQNATASIPDPIAALIVNAFVFAVLTHLIILGSSVVLGERIRINASRVKRSTFNLVEGLWSQLDARKPIRIKISREIECASVAGLLRPTVLLPVDVHQVGATEILHEIAHIQSRDLFWTFVTKICQSFFFALPWFHWFATEAHLWQEINADHVATSHSTARRYELAEAIVRMTAKAQAPLLSMSGAGKNVARRLDFLYRPVNGSWISLVAYTILLASMAPIPMMAIRAWTQGEVSGVRTKAMVKIVPDQPGVNAKMSGRPYSPISSKI